MLYRTVALLAGLALIVGLVLFSGAPREAVVPNAAGAVTHDPGYAALGARLVQTGADGQPLYSLDAARISQQPDESTVHLTQVQMGFRAANGQQWTARADRGELGQDTGVVQLDGDVHVQGLLPGTQDQAQISTDHISYDTRTEVVTTPASPETLGRVVSASPAMRELLQIASRLGDARSAVLLQGESGPDAELWGTWALYRAPRAVLEVHRRYVETGCHVISTTSRATARYARCAVRVHSTGPTRSEVRAWCPRWSTSARNASARC